MARRKNVLVVMADEQSWNTLGCNGNRVASTPHLDGLAERGSTFDHCYTPYPLCCPARASLWTGLLPHQHHVMGNWRHIRPDLADRGLVASFAADGYHTAYTGKWHVPGTTPARFHFQSTAAIPAVIKGRDRGRYIEAYRAYAESRGYQLVPGHIENLTARDLAQLRTHGKAPCGTAEIALDHFLETWQTAQFLEQLDARPAGQPFFAVCSFNAPHFPMIVPAPYDRLIDPAEVPLPASLRTGTAGKPAEVAHSHYAHEGANLDDAEWRRLIAHYWGLCSLVDAQVGRIVEYLEKHRLLEDTIVVFTADHGDMMGAHGLLEKGYPLHYEEALRVPLIVVDPDSPGGRRVNGLTSLIDVLPTLAELAGVHLTEPYEGRSVAASLDGVQGEGSGRVDQSAPTLRPHVIVETFTFGGSEGGEGEYLDLDRFEEASGTANLSIRTARERYIFRWNDGDEFYELTSDPGEERNAIATPAAHTSVERLRHALLGEIERTDPRFAALVRRRMETKG
jgi:arylsulfatase